MAIDLLFLTIGGFALLLGAWRLVRALRRGRPIGLAITMLALGGALIALADSVQQWESQLHPSLGRPVSNMLTLTAAYGLLLTVSDLAEQTPSPAVRRARLLGWLLAELILLSSFLATSGVSRGLGVFGDLYRTHPTLVVYVATYMAYLAVAVVEIFRVVTGSLRPSRGPLRVGLLVLLVACVLALIYLIGKLVLLAVALARGGEAEPGCHGSPLAGANCLINVTAPAVSVLAGALALLLMTLGTRLALWRAVADLAPLHRAVVARVPAVSRYPLPTATASQQRLVRIVVEIRDGLLTLGLGGGTPDQLARAVWQAEPDGGEAATAQGESEAQPADVWGEVDCLRPVARAYTRLSQDR